MIQLYLAEIQMLQVTDPEKYEDFLKGNWVVRICVCHFLLWVRTMLYRK